MYCHEVMWTHVIAISLGVIAVSIIIGCYFQRQSEWKMAQTGLLLVSNLSRAQGFLRRAAQHVNKTLYVGVSGTDTPLSTISKDISNIYSKSTSVCGDLDVRLLLKSDSSRIATKNPVQLVMLDEQDTSMQSVKDLVDNLETDFQVVSLGSSDSTPTDTEVSEVKMYDYVALGGTFDRLHNGHKILLSEAALRAKKHLTIGVTDVDMIQSKVLWELIEPLEQRSASVREFLQDIKPELEYDVVPLHDMFGPTKDDPRIQLLVVSEETARAGPKINQVRTENGLPELDLHTIQLVQDVVLSKEEEAKVSSSNRRMRLLGTLLRPPHENLHIPERPYILGLTGGIASGKTKITERLRKKGAAIVNCDLIGHDLYKPGLPLNNTIAEMFGHDIITETGEVDRRKLGAIVFNNKSELEKLNGIMWPAIRAEADRRARALGMQGYEVVVLEAAVMVEAGWHERVHQLWAVIVPPQEAVRRLVERNSLSEEAAWERVRAQPSNSVQVAEANVVFSPFWSYDYTQSQVDKAWDHLQQYIRRS